MADKTYITVKKLTDKFPGLSKGTVHNWIKKGWIEEIRQPSVVIDSVRAHELAERTMSHPSHIAAEKKRKESE